MILIKFYDLLKVTTFYDNEPRMFIKKEGFRISAFSWPFLEEGAYFCIISFLFWVSVLD